MSKNDPSFDALRLAIRGLWPVATSDRVALEHGDDMLLLRAPNDIAAFAVLNGHPAEDYPRAYNSFKRLYRNNSREWDERTLSFVVCRSSDRSDDDRFYAELETDPLFCRKYVIKARPNVAEQRAELLRLPFLPLPVGDDVGVQRPQPAQDLLQLASVSSSFARNLIEAGKRSPERIASDLLEGREVLPAALTQPAVDRLTALSPRATSKLLSLEVEGFRAYRDERKFDLDASVVVLYGPNGLGKTSFFDALDYACTGRIGRLCRNRRTQTDFSRIATHLDKTPGTGSVVLRVNSQGVASETWEVQRSTGDWTNSWIDQQEVDRKFVMNKLTQASWIESAPRQQTLESLFRATHLFGQGEQELLTEFHKGSVIPETFISEMLSLQDYSEGLSKIERVLSVLAQHREAAQRKLTELNDRLTELNALLDPEVAQEDDLVTPLESVVEHLRLDNASVSSALPALPEELSVGAYSEWLDVAVARQGAVLARERVGRACADALPEHARALKQSADLRTQLQTLDRELTDLNEREHTLSGESDLDAVSERNTNEKQRSLARQLQEVHAATEDTRQRADLATQLVVVNRERDQQSTALTSTDATLAETQSAISGLLGEVAAQEVSATTSAAVADQLRALLGEVGRFEEAIAELADTRSKIQNTEAVLRNIGSLHMDAETALQAAANTRTVLEPEYRRAIGTQAEVERLLTDLERHANGDSCPLCGSKFESIQVLRDAIRSERESRSTQASAIVTYQRSVDEEARASDRRDQIVAETKLTSSALDRLRASETEALQRLEDFRRQVFAATGRRIDDHQIAELLRTGYAAAHEKATADARALGDTRRRLDELTAFNGEQTARREAASQRIGQLDRSIENLAARSADALARVQQLVPDQDDAETALAELRGQLQQALIAAEAELKAIAARRISREDIRAELNDQKESIRQRQKAFEQALEPVDKVLSDFRMQLRSLNLPDDASNQRIAQVVEDESKQGAVLGTLIEQVEVVINALRIRDVRRRLSEVRQEIETVQREVRETNERLDQVGMVSKTCRAIETLLGREREGSIKRHIASYGPMITMIQQRLRSVYGFGGVNLQALGGEAKVQVEWRNKSVQVPPTDFFSDSQKQILMLSIFMAGGLRQNWSGFAPVLLDDPVTHFDDLNAYAFVELIRGIVATGPTEWQFIVSTCEQRLFELMQRKFSRLASGAIFYEFVGMTDAGPIIERR